MKKLLLPFLFILVDVPAYAATGDWRPLATGVDKNFTSISCPEPRTCYLASGFYTLGGTGAVVKTSDGGETFALLSLPSSNPLHAISCPSAQTCFAVGDFGTLLKTADGGEHWSESLLGSRASPAHLTGVYAIDEERVVVVGKDGFIYRTADSGKTWTPVSLLTLADLYGLYFTSMSSGFILGYDGTLLWTTDGGVTWSRLPSLRDSAGLLRLQGAGEGLLLAVGETAHKSTDRGKSWTKIKMGSSVPEGIHRGLAVVDEKTSYSLVGENEVVKSRDGGDTWESEAVLEAASVLRDIACPHAGYCLAVGGQGRAFRLGMPPPPPPPAPLISDAAAPATSTLLVGATTSAGTILPVAPVPETVPTLVPVETTKPVVSQTGSGGESATLSSKGVLSRTLQRGARGEDVKFLQRILAGVGGVYPEGDITGFFGDATKRAVGKFQEKYSIAVSGDAGYGQVGPRTRVKLIEAARGAAATETDSAMGAVSQTTPITLRQTLKRGSRGDEVKRLQEILSADKEIYPEGEVTGYFGPATAKAVGRFQERYDIAVPGDEGYGQVGPKTRSKLSELSR